VNRWERPAALWVVLHLAVVLLGALQLILPPAHPRSPLAWLAAYTEYTGAGNDYTFFAPAVGSQVRVRLLRTDVAGGRQEIRLTTSNQEVNFRINCMLLSSLKFADMRDPVARSWASLVLAADVEAAKVEVVAESYGIPSMAAYRAGARGTWREVYWSEFAALPPQPRRDRP
jgi:hypothetical protein